MVNLAFLAGTIVLLASDRCLTPVLMDGVRGRVLLCVARWLLLPLAGAALPLAAPTGLAGGLAAALPGGRVAAIATASGNKFPRPNIRTAPDRGAHQRVPSKRGVHINVA